MKLAEFKITNFINQPPLERDMAIYHVSEAERTLGSRPIEEAFLGAPAENPRFRMSDADLAVRMRTNEMDYGIGGPPPEKKYDGEPVLVKIFSGFENF